jgi:RHS repeat-associated protein
LTVLHADRQGKGTQFQYWRNGQESVIWRRERDIADIGARLQTVTYPNGEQIGYNYGSATGNSNAVTDYIMSRLSSISDSQSGQSGQTEPDAAFTYLGLDTVVAEDYPEAGVELNYDPSAGNTYSGLDRFGRVIDQFWQDYGNSTTADEESYIYGDADGNITQEQESATGVPTVSTNYGYDAMNRVTGWTQGSATKTYTYDSVGNNIASSTGGSYNAANEETPASGVGLSGYDLAGNMTTLSNGDTGVYDAWGRLVEVKNGSGQLVETMSYDGLGRRIATCNYSGGVLQSSTCYYCSGQQVVETVHNGSPQYQYIWSPLYVNAPICRDSLDANGNIIAASRTFYLADANFNVTAVVGIPTGGGPWQVLERYAYDPYGNVTIYSDTWQQIGGAADSQVQNTLFFAGESYDSSTGLYFDNARYYDPQLGRFISQDPMGYAGSGTNLYAYCGDNAIGAVDPFGLDPTVPTRYNLACDSAGGDTPQTDYTLIGEKQPGKQYLGVFFEDNCGSCVRPVKGELNTVVVDVWADVYCMNRYEHYVTGFLQGVGLLTTWMATTDVIGQAHASAEVKVRLDQVPPNDYVIYASLEKKGMTNDETIKDTVIAWAEKCHVTAGVRIDYKGSGSREVTVTTTWFGGIDESVEYGGSTKVSGQQGPVGIEGNLAISNQGQHSITIPAQTKVRVFVGKSSNAAIGVVTPPGQQ